MRSAEITVMMLTTWFHKNEKQIPNKLVHVLWYDILGRYFGMISRYFGMKIYYDFSQFSCEIYFEANSRLKRLSDFIKKNSTAIRSFFDSAERKKVNKFS